MTQREERVNNELNPQVKHRSGCKAESVGDCERWREDQGVLQPRNFTRDAVRRGVGSKCRIQEGVVWGGEGREKNRGEKRYTEKKSLPGPDNASDASARNRQC